MLFHKRTKAAVKWIWIILSLIIIVSMVGAVFVGGGGF